MSHELGSWCRTPLLLLPILLLWRFDTFVVKHTGFLLALTLGIALMLLGLTWIATHAALGIPVFILGFMLHLRALCADKKKSTLWIPSLFRQ